ncbi:LamG domain-containing protein [Catelliglobosispora koreensis]|uniref:LamG domain-containing protein n=1 Tax=Catelliglobosispora koreensis TaxID=129052 RepID=UPI00036CBA3D|nr:LamG domain-containing protein [Catelliglobosispora koreensis]
MAWAARVASLFIVTGVLAGGAGAAPPRPLAEAAAARIDVYFDFANGITGEIWDRGRQLQLREDAMQGGELIQLPRGDDWAVHFPFVCDVTPRDCPRVILESAQAGLLNPGTQPIYWGASVQMMMNEKSDGANVMQKGLSVDGTQYKLQVDGLEGRPSCAITTPNGRYVALSREGVADGTWHSLACARNGSVLTLFIDGREARVASVPIELSIENDHPLRIGGKGHGPYNDQFHGTIDDVFVSIG